MGLTEVFPLRLLNPNPNPNPISGVMLSMVLTISDAFEFLS